MIIEEEVLGSSAAASAASRRQNRRHAVAMGLATLPIAGAAVFAFRFGFGASDSRDVPTTTVATTAHVAVNEPVIAEPNPIQAPRSRDEIIRDLVRRGLVPAATLDDGTEIARLVLNPRRSLDDVIRDLVRRGLIPAATLDDGTQITTP